MLLYIVWHYYTIGRLITIVPLLGKKYSFVPDKETMNKIMLMVMVTKLNDEEIAKEIIDMYRIEKEVAAK